MSERTVRMPRTKFARYGFGVVLVGLLALAGFSLAPASEEGELPVPDGLTVLQVVPSDGSAGIETDATILVTFDRPVVPLTAVSDPASDLPHPLSLTPDAEGEGQWLNTSTYTFTPSEPLAGGTAYTVTVRSGLEAIDGTSLTADVIWSFTTVRPRVVWFDPNRDEDLVPIDLAISIVFNMPIDPASVKGRFSLRTGSLFGELFSRAIDGELEVDGASIRFTPSEPLAFDQSYVVTLAKGVTGHAGGLSSLDETSWRFRTIPLPRITGTTPRNGEGSAYSYTSFVIDFNAPIDPDTVLPNITIEPEPAPEDVDGWYRRWDRSYVISFGAQPSSEYTFTIGPDIADPYGNTTGQTLTVRFQTAPLDPYAWMHVPGRISTLNAAEAGRMVVGYRNTDRLQLKLWKIDLDEYFEAMDDWYEYSSSGSADRSWSLSVESPLNEVAYQPVDLAEGGGSLPPGIYVVELRADGVDWDRWNHRHLLISSTLNLTAKKAEDEILVWATSLETGEPVPGLVLWAYDREGLQLDATVTGADGLGSLESDGGYGWGSITLASRDPFVLSSTQWDDGMSIWDLGLPSESPTHERAFIDTDRPIYRPGQTIYFRGVARDEDDVSYFVPDEETALVYVRDAAWETIYEGTLELDMFGVFSGEIALAEDASLGDYQIRVEIGSRSFYDNFQVAAYRAPEFEVTVTPERAAVALGDLVRALVSADYFFGAPMSGADVEWNVLSSTYRFSPEGFGQYTFTDVDDPWTCWYCWWIPAESPASILSGSGITDDDGQLLVEFLSNIADPTNEEDDPVALGSRTLTIEATAYGPSGDVVSGRSQVVAHRASFYAGIASGRAIGRAGESMDLDVVAVDWNGIRLPAQALRYTVYQREWLNVFEEDDSGGGSWSWTVEDTEVASGSLSTDADGEGTFAFMPPEGGSYKVVVEGEDADGRTARSSRFLWVTGPESVSWRRSNDDTIQLISDRTSYEVGDIAEILVPSPFEGPQWALVTVERGGILAREVVLLPTNSSLIEIPITEDCVPNVYVGVVVVQGRENALALLEGAAATAGTKVGYAALTVDPEPKTLRIDLVPSSEQLEPGQTLSVALHVTDDLGLPISGSFSFDLVDKAVLSLQPRISNEIVSEFYGQRGLSVYTSSGLSISLSRLVLEQLDDLDLLDKYAADEDMVAGAATPSSAEPLMFNVAMEGEELARAFDDAGAAQLLPEGVELREEFLDTAFWHASVLTDAAGFAQIEVELPDNLTTWVARAVGVTMDTLVGEETTEILVTKPLLIRPSTPRFFVVGDRVELSASVSNQTDEARMVDVTLGAVGVSLDDPATQTIEVPARSEVKVTWSVDVLDVPAADLAFSAVSGELTDAARPRLTLNDDGTLPVFKYTTTETVGTAGQISDEGVRVEAVAVPEIFDPARSELSVRVDPSLAAAMLEGLYYLEHFEYECTEQLVSRFLPNVLTYRALASLGIKDEEMLERLNELVPEAIAELVDRQNSDGGWGWWSDLRSSSYLTAYTVFGLVRAAEAGFDVPRLMLERAIEYLTDELVPTRDLESVWGANRQAWLVYVLATAGEDRVSRDRAEELFEERAKLSHYAKAYLAMALQELGGDPGGYDMPIETLVSDLTNDAILSATGAHWEEETIDWWAMNTDTRSTGIVLDALVQVDPDNALLPNVVRWLMVAREAGIWETTQETAWALIALTDWMVLTNELQGSYDVSVDLAGTTILQDSVSPDTVRDPRQTTVDGTQFTGGELYELAIERSAGPGTLYYTAHWTVGFPVELVEPLDRGISVKRHYVYPGTDKEIPEEQLSVYVGEAIEVRLTIVAPNDLYYVVIEDPIPAGCEAIDPSLATTSLLASTPSIIRDDDTWWGGWWWNWFSRTEFRDDKVVLFADYLASGTYQYSYTFRGVIPGSYHVMPASAHEFYFPEVFGRSDGRLFDVLSEPDVDAETGLDEGDEAEGLGCGG